MAADGGKRLQVTASYADTLGSGKSASKATEAVTVAPPEVPQFAAYSAERRVYGTKPAGTNIGAPVTATDSDGDALTYGLTGEDAGTFAIDTATGQLKIKDMRIFEKPGVWKEASISRAYYVTVTVSDGKADDGSADHAVDDTIAVTIRVNY